MKGTGPRMQRAQCVFSVLILAFVTGCLLVPVSTEAGFGPRLFRRALPGGSGQAARKQTIRKAFAWERARDLRTPVRDLYWNRTAFRYTTRHQARIEAKKGLAPSRHMTARAKPGAPLSGMNAQRRYGLPRRPQVRETIRLQRGFGVRSNKAIGGRPGFGELTSPHRVPPSAIRRVVPLRHGRG